MKADCYVAGWLSYEFAGAFDDTLKTGPAGADYEAIGLLSRWSG